MGERGFTNCGRPNFANEVECHDIIYGQEMFWLTLYYIQLITNDVQY